MPKKKLEPIKEDKDYIGPRPEKIDFNRLADLYKSRRANAHFEDIREDYKYGGKNPSNKPEDKDDYDDPERKKRKGKYQWGRWVEEDQDALPYVPKPSMMQPDPFVVGSPREAVLAKRLLDLDPATKQRVKGITFGPTKDSMEEVGEYPGLDIDDFEYTNLLGVTKYRGPGNIGINPRMAIGSKEHGYDWDAAKTMAHEIAHRAGHGHQRGGANEIGDKVRGLFKNYPTARNRYD